MRKPAFNFSLLLGALALCLVACQPGNGHQQQRETAAAEKAPPAIDFSVVPGKRVGRITSRSTESDIKDMYGEEQVEIRSVYIGEGESQPGMVLFPNTSNELEIVWDIAAATGTPEFIRISNKESDWTTREGVRINTTLEELEKINGRPFQLYGLGWDYSGLVTGWNGGKLTSHLIVALAPEDWEKVQPDVSGERLFSSENPAIQGLGLRVASMVITFER